MRIHVTNVYGFSPRSVVQLSQHEVVDILKDLCDSEIGLYILTIKSQKMNYLRDMMG